MYVGDIQSKLKNRLKQHLYINIVINQHSSNSSGMQRYYKIIIYPRCYVILMKLYSQCVSRIISLWLKNILCCSSAGTAQPQSWNKGHVYSHDAQERRNGQHSLTSAFAFHTLFCLYNYILPFYCPPNLGHRGWKHLFDLHKDFPMTHAGRQQGPTAQVTSGEELGTVSIS